MISVAGGTDGGLHQRRDVVDRQLGGDLIEAPGQTEHYHDARRQRVERAGRVMVR
jgi:hypothetical protein